ncbi:MAG: CBS domain-containing protein [Candidatus Gottesmanbacteria bacterium]|nr:CBS domain-containing protein [Candidatus Gottesmanbacteria bacterium]
MTNEDFIQPQKTYMLNDLIGTKVLLHGRRIGTLGDIIARENGTLPVVTHFYITRLFGSPSLCIPWDRVRAITKDEIVVDIPDTKQYEAEPSEMSIQLKDQVLDKKVLDTEDRDIDIVYDIRLIQVNDTLLVSAVDISHVGLLRRIGLGWLGTKLSKTSDEKRIISWKYIQPLPTPLGRFVGDVKLKILKERLEEIHPADLADILEEMDYSQRAAIVSQLDSEHASAALEEIDPKSQRELISALKKEKIVQLLAHMTASQAADILSVLPYSEGRTILKLMNASRVKKIKSIMTRQERDILNYATTRFIKFPPEMTVENARAAFYQAAKGKKVVMYLYITDTNDKLLKIIDLKELLQARSTKRLKDIGVSTIVSLSPKSSFHSALTMFERYDYRAIPILDEEGKILGVVPYRDFRNLKHRFLE